MGKDWKKKVNDFFFYEEEVVEEVEVIADTKEVESAIQNRQIVEGNRAVNAKVTYQYPKDGETPFRFPLIPDAKEQKASRKQNKKRFRTVSKTKQIEENQLIHGYRNQKSITELDEVPAYMRRKTNRKIKEQVKPTIDEPSKDETSKIVAKPIKPLNEYTRPDELDRVFRKRDGLLEEEIVSKIDPFIDRETSRRDSGSVDKEAGDLAEEITVKRPFVHLEETEASPLTDVVKQTEEQMKLDEQILPVETDRPAVHHDVTEGAHNVLSENEREQTVVYQENEELFNQAHTFSPQENEQQINDELAPMDEAKLNPLASEQIVATAVSSELDVTEAVPGYLLNDPILPTDDDSDWLREQQILLEQTLRHFKIKASVVNVTQGPAVTRFEVQPALGVKVSRIRNLADDIKLNLSAKDIRIEAPIPGKNTIGIEVPNMYPQVVGLQEIIESEPFESEESPLTIALGLSIEGDPLITNIGKMPHGLIAGATGSGKSVCINTIILSVLYKADYDEVKLLLIDPKMVELTPYNGIPHLISPVITDPKAATMALKWAVEEMEARYEKFVEAGVRNIIRYNEKATKQQTETEKMPYIVIIIDELADLMMVSPQDVEDAICRIAQKARACGIHLIVATQRPSVDVITGLIKANIPTRIAFSVSSQVDSRTIIDTNGAEKLLGKGDMLFVENGSNKSVRLQGPFVSDEEIDRVANHLRQIAAPNYLFEQEQLLIEVNAEDEDELMSEVISFALEQNQVSTSLLQRRFRIGYNRAARLIDTLENKGIISAQNGSKPREVLASKSQLNELD